MSERVAEQIDETLRGLPTFEKLLLIVRRDPSGTWLSVMPSYLFAAPTEGES